MPYLYTTYGYFYHAWWRKLYIYISNAVVQSSWGTLEALEEQIFVDLAIIECSF